MAKSESVATLDLQRVADEVNVILTEVYGNYVAQGSPTKLGGLRFLDVESSKTFAFERTEVAGDGIGNLLVLSAPAPAKLSEEALRKVLEAGPHGDRIRRLTVRGSSDVGKADKRFMEVAYYFETAQWLTDDQIMAYAKEHHIVNAREAMVGIIQAKLLPIAGDVMENLITEIRKQG